MSRHESTFDVEKAEQRQAALPTSTPPSSPFQPSPSPTAAGEEAAAANSCKLHPMVKIMQEKELGKFLLASAIAILGIVVAGREALGPSEMSAVLIPVSFGFTAIFYGIMLKDTFPIFAQVVEAVGIVLIAVSFYMIIAFFMPIKFSWAPGICIVLLCLLPLIVLVLPPATYRN